MIRINLLPHREEKRRARRQQFYALLGMVTVLAGVIWFFGYTFINGRISDQDGRNEFLKTEIASLEKEISEIQKLKQQTEALLARKRVIELLQSNRTETVHLFNELARQVPDGVYLRSLKQTGTQLSLGGYAQSNARVTTLMNNMDGSPLLTNSRLVETKAETVGGSRLNAFNVGVMIKSQAATPAPDGRKVEKKP